MENTIGVTLFVSYGAMLALFLTLGVLVNSSDARAASQRHRTGQARGIEHIASSLNEIEGITQQAASSAQQMSAQSEAMGKVTR